MPRVHTLAGLVNPTQLSVQKIACLGDEIGFAYGSLHVEELLKSIETDKFSLNRADMGMRV
jgi:hypothetical protein